jgi:ABC-type iron transport system FetAB ATPase subunit
MRNPLQLRCNQLERSMRTLHDECERLMRENAMLRERMQGFGGGETQIYGLDQELARIAAGPSLEPDTHVIHASSMRMY